MPPQLSTTTFSFLSNLKAHNDRAWMESHRNDYLAAREEVIALVDAVRAGAEGLEPALAGQSGKELLYRLYRDIRFSKDKTPFKTHFGAYFSRGGRKWEGAGYYLHLEPDSSFLAAGIWMPEPALLKALRQEIDYGLDELETILQKPSFKKKFPAITGEAITRPPKGYDAENPALLYLKQKSFLVQHPLPDEILHSRKAVPAILGLMEEAAPLVAFLNRATD